MKKIIAAIVILAGASSLLNAAQPSSEPQRTSAFNADNTTSAGHILLSLPDFKNDLKRSNVTFDHEKHTRALKENSCRTCHPDNPQGGLVFTFPKDLPDTADVETLMNAWHNACIDCHNERIDNAEPAGPITCGQCHVRETEHMAAEHIPILPSYYEPMRDIYHGECLNCHSEPARTTQNAPVLDWKKFQVLRGNRPEPQIPHAGFDYQRHALHSQTLDKDCGLCHQISPEKQQALARENREPQCRDWQFEPDPKESWREQDFAHAHCVNCHFKRTANKEDKSGPLLCSECHTSSTRTPEQMLETARIDCEQKEKILISSGENMVMEAVPFDHAEHQLRTRACQDCHHNGIQACKECHTVQGDEKAKFVTLAQAYHREDSDRSCIGCHKTRKQKPECAGCHQQLPSTLTATGACATCHSGSLEALDHTRTAASPESLIAPNVKESWPIEKIGETYAKIQFNHLAITRDLAAVCNESSLASYFHISNMTLCAACHHYSPLEPEKPVPGCSTCHDSKTADTSGRPDLLGAYHQQCLGCHQQMGGTEEKMPLTCDGCHAHKQQ